MGKLTYPKLFEPIRLGGTLFRNRIFAAPTGYRDFTYDMHIPEPGMEYYERKATGGAASVAIGECIVDSEFGRHGPTNLKFDDPGSASSLMRMTNLITHHGAVASAELMHAGSGANAMTPGLPAYGPVEGMNGGKPVFAMTEEIIERTIERYAAAAAFAKQCGFGMVTIHAGHGWLPHQFMSPITNTRRDRWGGSDIENRMRFPLAVIEAIRRRVGPRFPIEVRMSGSECHDAGYGIDEGVAMAKRLDGKVDLIHISAGDYRVDDVFPITHPSMFLDEGCNVKYAAEIKKHVKTPVATVGALGGAMMEEIIASGRADVVELARGLLADPDMPDKLRRGEPEEVRGCLRCLNCFSVLLTTGRFYCSINPEIGREHEYASAQPPRENKTVLVAGGGVAGMQAAITCAERGHRVILCERNDRLGGVLLCEEKAPFKFRLANYIEYQTRRVKSLPIDLRLNTEVTPELAEAVGADVVIAAIGAAPAMPPIPGIEKTVPVTEAFNNPEKTGDKIVVLGGGLAGVELAIFLSQLGKIVTVIEMLPELNHGGNYLHMKGVNVQIKKYGIDIHTNTRALSVCDNGVLAATQDGETFFNADTVVCAAGTTPRQDEASALRSSAPQFIQLGDCLSSGNIMAATAAADGAARDIGR